MGRKRTDPIPNTKEIDGMTFHIHGKFTQRTKANTMSKRLHKQGNWSRVVEVQRGHKRYHAVYVKSGRKEKEQAEKRKRTQLAQIEKRQRKEISAEKKRQRKKIEAEEKRQRKREALERKREYELQQKD